MPLPYRWLTSLMMRYNGKSILIDCGEGTQIAMREKGWSPNPIDIICFTHFHADHISGLPGMLLTMGNAERTEPLLLIGPRGLAKVVASLRVIAPELPFEVKCMEITENAQTFSFEGFRLEAFKVNHNVLCYGYSMVIDRAGRFDKDRALEQEIPMKFWSRLQKGETLEENGRVFTPDMVLGAERKGLKVTYSTDTRPTESIRQNAQGADLLILEGMYGEPDKLVKAREHKHMTMYEAAKIDGANNLSILVQIMLPLVFNTFMLIILINFITFWNDYYTPLIYLKSYPTLAYGLQEFWLLTKQDTASSTVKLAACMIVFVPIFVLFIFFSDKLIGNISMGGIKE